ncbi:MAG: flavodoxin family protein [Dehalobacterium sp.]|jgi:multimeric flavodoxin WrbA
MRKVLIIATSPRKKGNTDLLAQWAADIAQENNYESEIIYLREYRFSPCIACGACNKDGRCHVKDEMIPLYPKITGSEKIIFTAPIYFQALGALPKALIDRTQCYWAAHYILNEKVIRDDSFRAKRGLFALLCGATNLPDTFLCAEKSLKIFASTVEANYEGGLFFPDIDEKGAIREKTDVKEKLTRGLNSFLQKKSS